MISKEDLARRLRMEYRKGKDPFIDYLVRVIAEQDRRIDVLSAEVQALKRTISL